MTKITRRQETEWFLLRRKDVPSYHPILGEVWDLYRILIAARAAVANGGVEGLKTALDLYDRGQDEDSPEGEG